MKLYFSYFRSTGQNYSITFYISDLGLYLEVATSILSRVRAGSYFPDSTDPVTKSLPLRTDRSRSSEFRFTKFPDCRTKNRMKKRKAKARVKANTDHQSRMSNLLSKMTCDKTILKTEINQLYLSKHYRYSLHYSICYLWYQQFPTIF